MVKPVSTRTIISKAFLGADEVDPDELPGRLKTLCDFVAEPTARGCRNFTQKMQLWREKELYKHFNPTWEEFLAEHFPQPIQWIEHVMDGVKLLDPKATVAQLKEVLTSADRAKAIAVATVPLKEYGSNQHRKEEKLGVDNDKLLVSPKGGTDPEYLTARIARDRPDILEKMKAGEFKSVRQAAIAADIIKPTKQIKACEDPAEMARLLVRKFGADYLRSLIESATSEGLL